MNLIIITSIIKTPNKPFSYNKNGVRSIFDYKTRYEQTKKTIISIKEKIPDCKILIVECSNLDNEQEYYFQNNSDYMLNLYNDEKLKNKIYGLSKSLGEGTMTIEALKYIKNNNIIFNNLFKISGRYWLSDKFFYYKFNNNKIVIKKINNNINNIFTALYKIPKENVDKLLFFLEHNISTMEKCIGYEVLFSIFVKNIGYNNVIFLNRIGISGYVSVDPSNTLYNW